MRMTRQRQIFEQSTGGSNARTPFNDIIAIGTVVDANDPMQWGRLRVMVTAWGDSVHHETEGLPWAMYVSPFGGTTSLGTRGPSVDQTSGSVAYGMWAIPKVGAQVVVMSLDEEHNQRLYLGCVFDALTANTLPHGRWTFDDHPALDGKKPAAPPFGPYSGSDGLIQPLSNNLQLAFNNSAQSLEWQTRAADYSAARVDVSYLQYTASNVPDDKATMSEQGWSSTQGYQVSRVEPNGVIGEADKNYDSHTYSITTPGFHSLSMDDRMENCRVRLRTTSGHQILMDDTNERIYIATAQGNNWIELDQAGNIDIFTTNKVNIHAAQDINMTSDKTIRMFAKEGIHMKSDKDIRIQAKEDIHVKTDKNIRQRAGKDILTQAEGNLHLRSKSNINITSGAIMNLKASGELIQTASDIHQNGPAAAEAQGAKELAAFYTNRIPMHEPWGRMMTKSDTSLEGELSYDDPNVGKMEGGITIKRGIYWRR